MPFRFPCYTRSMQTNAAFGLGHTNPLSIPSIMVCAVLSLISVWGIPADSIQEEEGSGIEIHSTPTGATVRLDGIRRGKTPLVIDDLTPGRHFLVLEKDGCWDREITLGVPENKKLIVELELSEATGFLKVGMQAAALKDGTETRRQFKPILSIDGTIRHTGRIELKEGLHRVRVQAFGFLDEARTVMIVRGMTSSMDIELQKADFSIEKLRTARARFNPRNPGLLGSCRISFRATVPGTATVYLDTDGTQLVLAELPEFTSWEQGLLWDGRDGNGNPVHDGSWEIHVEAESIPHDGEAVVTSHHKTAVVVDSTIRILPASIAAGSAGYLFAPDTRLLPAGSFELEAASLFGKPYGSTQNFGPPPYALGFRMVPVDGWEPATSVRVNTDRESGDDASFGLALKRSLLTPGRIAPFASAVVASWVYEGAETVSAFGTSPGLELAFPFELRLGEVNSLAGSLVASPALSWSGSEGIPMKAVPDPVFAAAAGIHDGALSAGISGKVRVAEKDGNFSWAPAFIGAELHFFPPPSLVVFSVFGGAWLDGPESGAFGGLGLGILY